MSNTKNNLPAMPFYVGDWFKCTEVRALPPDYRGLWFDMICFMWESTERGVLVNPKGKPYSDADIVRMVGLDNQNSGIWLTRLIDDGVCSRRDDGAIYSKRMVKDEKLRATRKESGQKGGNPVLLVNQKDNQFVEYEREGAIDNEPLNTTKTSFASVFEDIWTKYPKRIGKKEALRHFMATVKTEEDVDSIWIALKNYETSERVFNGFIQNGATWFNNWRDWVEFKEVVCLTCKGKGRYTSNTGYENICSCPRGNKIRTHKQ